MKLARCPSCHADLNLDTLVQDGSAKSLLAVAVKLKPNLAINLIGYIALWRPKITDLNNARAVTLINEVLELSSNEPALNAALEQTVIAIKTKRMSGIYKPFKNHSYLCQVLETTETQYQQTTTSTKKVEGSRAVVKNGFQESAEVNKEMFQKIQDQYRT